MSSPAFTGIEKIARFSLTTANADRLADFYERAFGCRRIATKRVGGPCFEKLMNVRGGARQITLCLGNEVIELLQFDEPGQPYPEVSSSSDLVFQHFALVVCDMAEAYSHLQTISGWSAISSGGPQQLPEYSGRVTAFKFRDTEGHPLELLAFSAGQGPQRWQSKRSDIFLGIDHSAISVSETCASIEFYSGLGFDVSSSSLNHGITQSRLDDIASAHVEVTSLTLSQDRPHLELLCYKSVKHRYATSRSNDIASTKLILKCRGHGRAENETQRLIRDGDGHQLMVVSVAERD